MVCQLYLTICENKLLLRLLLRQPLSYNEVRADLYEQLLTAIQESVGNSDTTTRSEYSVS
jgi:hypothetical protein